MEANLHYKDKLFYIEFPTLFFYRVYKEFIHSNTGLTFNEE